MTHATASPARILVVEDQYLIRMMLEDMLVDLGHDIAAAVGTMAEASDHARNGDFHVAILDVNVDGEQIFPVADIIAERGLPFAFLTGYSESSLPDAYRGCPTLLKPFQAAQLATTIAGLLAAA